MNGHSKHEIELWIDSALTEIQANSAPPSDNNQAGHSMLERLALHSIPTEAKFIRFTNVKSIHKRDGAVKAQTIYLLGRDLCETTSLCLLPWPNLHQVGVPLVLLA